MYGAYLDPTRATKNGIKKKKRCREILNTIFARPLWCMARMASKYSCAQTNTKWYAAISLGRWYENREWYEKFPAERKYSGNMNFIIIIILSKVGIALKWLLFWLPSLSRALDNGSFCLAKSFNENFDIKSSSMNSEPLILGQSIFIPGINTFQVLLRPGKSHNSYINKMIASVQFASSFSKKQ